MCDSNSSCRNSIYPIFVFCYNQAVLKFQLSLVTKNPKKHLVRDRKILCLALKYRLLLLQTRLENPPMSSVNTNTAGNCRVGFKTSTSGATEMLTVAIMAWFSDWLSLHYSSRGSHCISIHLGIKKAADEKLIQKHKYTLA